MSRLRTLVVRARALKERREAQARTRRQPVIRTTEQNRARLRELQRIAAARVAAGWVASPPSSPAAKRKRERIRELMRAAAARVPAVTQALTQNEPEGDPDEREETP